MQRPAVIWALIVVGACLLCLGLLWNRLFPTKLYWTDADAQEFSGALVDAHEKSHMHPKNDAEREQVAAANKRFDEMRQRLDSARRARSRIGTWLTLGGAMLAGAGIVLYLRSHDDES
jgi:hypothetical protein